MAHVAAVPGLGEVMQTTPSTSTPSGYPYRIPNPPTTTGTSKSGSVGGGSHARPGNLVIENPPTEWASVGAAVVGRGGGSIGGRFRDKNTVLMDIQSY